MSAPKLSPPVSGRVTVQRQLIYMQTIALIDQILDEYTPYLQKDLLKYKNHVYRTFNLCVLLDIDSENRDKYAIASAFHDLGIWTNKTFDYLEPSIALAKKWLAKNNLLKWDVEISTMIDMHHKITPYQANFANTVDTFRKADWIDVSYGLLNAGLDKKRIKELNSNFPTKGFHRFLLQKAIQNILTHPLAPLPMFKK